MIRNMGLVRDLLKEVGSYEKWPASEMFSPDDKQRSYHRSLSGRCHPSVVCPLKSDEFGGIYRPFTFTGKTQWYQGKLRGKATVK